MNILLLTTRLNLGGVGVYTSSLATSLMERGEGVIVASSGGELTEELKRYNIEHIYLPINTSADIGPHILAACFKLSGVIKKHKIHIIHAQTRVAQVIAYFLSKSTGGLFVSTCHGFFKKSWYRKQLPFWGKRVIAISDAVRDYLINDMRVSADKIKLIYNGIDKERLNTIFSDAEKAAIRKEYGLKGSPVLGIIARLSGVKGHRYLFGAFKRILFKFPDAQMLVIGDGPANYVKGLKDLIERLGIREKVVFHKGCKDTRRPLAIIDVFCSPSLQEGLGLSIIEAMAAGLPVVASNVGGISTLIKDGHNGILAPAADEKALSEAVITVLNNPKMASRMGAVSKDIVAKDFTLDIMTTKVLEVYREALNG